MIGYQYRAFLSLMVVLLSFLVIVSAATIAFQGDVLRAEARHDIDHELKLMSAAAVDYLLKNDYAMISMILSQWSDETENVVKVKAIAPNGFVLIDFSRPEPPSAEAYTVLKDVTIGAKQLLRIEVMADYRSVESGLRLQMVRIVLVALFFMTAMGLSLWYALRRMALAPMQEEIARRARIEHGLQEARDELEVRVRERTAALAAQLEERLKTEAALRAREEHIRLLLNSTAEGIYGIDRNGTCTFCNPACLRFLGYEREQDLLGKRMHQQIHHTRPDGSPYAEEECRIYSAGRENRVEHVDDEVFWRADGSSFPVEYWSHPVIERGQVTGAVVTFVDTTERSRSQEFIRNVLETVDEGFLVVDRNYTILSANRAYSAQVGMPVGEIVGRTCYEISHRRRGPCSDEEGECALRKVFETGEPCSEVHEHPGPGEAGLKVEIKAYPVKDAAGAVISVIMTTTDISEKSRLEEQLRQAQKMEAVGQLAGGVAHDFNNVLTAVVGYASLLRKQAEEGTQARFFADQILASSERAANLTRQILAFSRKQIIDPRPVDLNDIIRGMNKLISRLLGEDIEITTSLADRNVTIMADAGQMEQVLMNLCTNARDAMPNGGRLTIGTDTVVFDRSDAELNGLGQAGPHAVLTVSDTGTGMDDKIRERIFEPFFTTKELGRGTGLGLAIVYGIIKQHRGQINVSTRPGSGTTFRICLPLTGEAADVSRAAADIPVPGGTETVLLAEDDETVRVLVARVLEEAGYRVIAAADGEAAVELFRKHLDGIALCLFDVMMPKKNGREAINEIRAIRNDIKALFMSGYSADVVSGREILGEDMALVAKPVMPHQLLRAVRAILDA